MVTGIAGDVFVADATSGNARSNSKLHDIGRCRALWKLDGKLKEILIRPPQRYKKAIVNRVKPETALAVFEPLSFGE
jgi:hypothetical protein